MNRIATDDINVLAMAKGDERYVFLFPDEMQAGLHRTLGQYAADPELSFTWRDAATLSQKARKLVKKAAARREDK